MSRRLDLSAFRAVDETDPPAPTASAVSDSGAPTVTASDSPARPARASRKKPRPTPSAPPGIESESGTPPVSESEPPARPARASRKKPRPAPSVPAAIERAGKVGPLLPPELAARLRHLGAEGYVISSVLTHALAEFGEAWLADRRQQTGPRRRSDVVGRVQVTLYLPGSARTRLQKLAEAAGTSQSEAATGVLRLALSALESGGHQGDD